MAQINSPILLGEQPRKTDPNKFKGNETVYHSYAGTDIVASILLPGEEKPLELGELQTISYSIHRENTPLRTIGHTSPRGFIRGPRTTAGSMIFTVFNVYAFYRLQQYQKLVMNNSLYPLADMLPPFDIVLTFASETASFARLKIYGVTIVDDGSVMSVDDLITEQTLTFMARSIQPLTPYLPQGYQDSPEKFNPRQVNHISFK